MNKISNGRLVDDEDREYVNLASRLAGEDTSSDVLVTQQRVSYTNLSSDTSVVTGVGRLHGFVVNSHTSGTIKIWDSTAASGAVLLNTITLAAGPQQWVFPVGIQFGTGLYVDVGGTIDVTILWEQ